MDFRSLDGVFRNPLKPKIGKGKKLFRGKKFRQLDIEIFWSKKLFSFLLPYTWMSIYHVVLSHTSFYLLHDYEVRKLPPDSMWRT